MGTMKNEIGKPIVDKAGRRTARIWKGRDHAFHVTWYNHVPEEQKYPEYCDNFEAYECQQLAAYACKNGGITHILLDGDKVTQVQNIIDGNYMNAFD